MKSFFFIPGNHPKLEEKVKTIKADQFIIDLEDAIDSRNLSDYIERLTDLKDLHKFYVRPALFDDDKLNEEVLIALIDIGVKNFMIPKFSSLKELQLIENCLSGFQLENINFILLIENPKSLFQLPVLLEKTKLKLAGIVFGSHDYCGETGMVHRLNTLYYPRFTIVSMAKSYGLIAIDIVNTNLNDDNDFINELDNGFEMGFDAKALIHPKQLQILDQFKSSKRFQLVEAEKILKTYKELGKPPVFTFKGKVIEAPHIKFYSNLIKKIKDYGN